MDVPDELVAAALSGWGLLATTVPRAWVATRMTVQHLKVFRDLLGGSDIDVRMEAGENLALLHESRLILGLAGTGYPLGEAGGGAEEGSGGDGESHGDNHEEGDEGDDADADADEAGGGEEEAIDLTVVWEEVVEEMKGFITDSNKKVYVCVRVSSPF